MARALVLAAGGIVLRREPPPRIAVVRLRKRDEWVLPKGKLDDGETPRTAARREVLEETGHNVTVHEFLGTLVYEAGGRAKVVHYWRMEAGSEQVRELMHDVRAVEWLPLDAAIARLSRASERVFLENVGPIAVSAMARQLKEKAKRREDVDAVPQLPFSEFAPVPQPLEPAAMAEPEIALSPDEAEGSEPEALQAGDGEAMPPRHERASFAERVRNWLGRDV
jgi:8-oxo-dGTP diphosphatase